MSPNPFPTLGLALLACLAAALWASAAPAAEIGDLAVAQEGREVVWTFDVKSDAEAVFLSLTLELKKTPYGPGDLTLQGDVGTIAPGPGKRIVWKADADFPQGYSGPVDGLINVTDLYTEPLTRMTFSLVPGGCFEMGCGEWTSGCEEDESPARRACPQDYYLADKPVTNAQFALFLTDRNSRDDQGPYLRIVKKEGKFVVEEGFEDAPVTGITLPEAERFAQWLSEKTGRDFSLPSEAQWEYACRNGGRWHLYSTPTGRLWTDYPDAGAGLKTSSPANLFGIEALSGGVWEWVSDAYTPYSQPPDENPGPDAMRILRGGRLGGEARFARCLNRYPREPDARDPNVGFRLALTPN